MKAAKQLRDQIRDFNARDGRPAPVRSSIEQLARSVWTSDNFDCPIEVDQIAHVLEVALKTRIGLAGLGGTPVVIDLGNGHVLECHVRKKPP